MKCKICGRQLKKDSKYCDFCGVKVSEELQGQQEYKKVFDTAMLLKGILISVGITVVISFIISGFGLPVIFGGLFLPFFFKKKKIKEQAKEK